MRRRTFLGASAALPLFSPAAPAAPAPTIPAITLPKPQTTIGKPLMVALSERRTTRTINSQKLTPQTMSNLLWAGFGINRPDGHRTAPTAMNVQDIDIYVFTAEGAYLYDAAANELKPVVDGDHRGDTGSQEGVAQAPATFVYVTNLEKHSRGRNTRDNDASLLPWANVHVGFIAQNVYLYAASEGLAAWFRASIDPTRLATLLNLKPSQKVLYAQTVGHR